MALHRKILWGAIAVLFVGVVLGWLYLRGSPSGSVRLYFPVPDFSFTERSGRRVSRADLLGKVWIADFIYTRCEDTCPLQAAEMASLQADFGGEKNFRLVSFSIDPEWDTPKVLADYARKHGADPERWWFLTGDKKKMYELVREGFRLSVAEAEAGPTSRKTRPGGAGGTWGGGLRGPAGPLAAFLRWVGPAPAWAHHPTGKGKDAPFTHASRFVLVDRKAWIRGYYHSDDAESLDRLRSDVRRLLPPR